eukprot:345635-Hanusia_phi.AAC.1
MPPPWASGVTLIACAKLALNGFQKRRCMAIVEGPGGGGCNKMGGSGGSDRSVQRRVGYSRGIGFDSHT